MASKSKQNFCYILTLIYAQPHYKHPSCITNVTVHKTKELAVDEASVRYMDFVDDNSDVDFSDEDWERTFFMLRGCPMDCDPFTASILTINTDTCKTESELDITDEVYEWFLINGYETDSELSDGEIIEDSESDSDYETDDDDTKENKPAK